MIINIASTFKRFNYVDDYVNMLASNGYFPLITLPTRVTDISSTIIDHIITNNHNNNILLGVIKTDLCDQYPLFCSFNTSASFAKTYKLMLQRNLQKFNC